MSEQRKQSPVEPKPEDVIDFVTQNPDEPVAMVNLLAFREEAAYPPESGEAACSGREAYMRYAQVAQAEVEKLGGKIIFMAGSSYKTLIGSGDWDDVAVVIYPSRRAFAEMGQVIAANKKARQHRIAGLARTVLIPCSGANYVR